MADPVKPETPKQRKLTGTPIAKAQFRDATFIGGQSRKEIIAPAKPGEARSSIAVATTATVIEIAEHPTKDAIQVIVSTGKMYCVPFGNVAGFEYAQ